MSSKRYTVYTCDICGKEGERCHSGTIEEFRAYKATGDFIPIDIPIDVDFDICDDCYEKIKAFINTLKAEANHD